MNTNPAPYVLGSEEGEAFWFFGGLVTQPIPASAGSFVHAPAGVAHAFQVDSGTARILNAPPPDMERIMAAAQEYGVEILGPPPGAHA
jgi:uncharacterized protein YjlB